MKGSERLNEKESRKFMNVSQSVFYWFIVKNPS